MTNENEPNETAGQAAQEQKAIKRSIYDLIEEEINASESPLDEKNRKLSKLAKVRKMKLNIMFVGPTGVGKSSTINALFDMGVAKVGSIDPETTSIQRYELENLIIWDTPGLGDSRENDQKYMELIRRKLCEQDPDGIPIIDLVLVILDAASRDLGTVFGCINNIIVPAMGQEAKERIIIGINRIDLALNGRHWNDGLNRPDMALEKYLEEKTASVKRRVYDSTGVQFNPICYCAGFCEDGMERKPYNLSRLLYCIMATVPKEKRLALADVMNPDTSLFKDSDEEQNYQADIRTSLWDSVAEYAESFSNVGVEVGAWIAGAPGGLLLGVAFGAVGAIAGFFNGLFG